MMFDETPDPGVTEQIRQPKAKLQSSRLARQLELLQNLNNRTFDHIQTISGRLDLIIGPDDRDVFTDPAQDDKSAIGAQLEQMESLLHIAEILSVELEYQAGRLSSV